MIFSLIKILARLKRFSVSEIRDREHRFLTVIAFRSRHTEAKFFFEFLDEENRDDRLKATDLNEIFAQIFIQITTKF